MKFIKTFLLLVLLSGCTIYHSQPLPEAYNELREKQQVTDRHWEGSVIIPYQSSYPFYYVIGWLDSKTILIMEEFEGRSIMSQYHLFSSEKDIFYETPHIVHDVHINSNQSIIAIQEFNQENQSADLLFLERSGELLMKLEGFGEQYNVYFHPDNQNEVIVTAFLPDWQHESYYLDIWTNELLPITIEEAYVQWLPDAQLAYIKRGTDDMNVVAPLYRYSIKENKEEYTNQDLIEYQYLGNSLSLHIDAETIYEENSVYSFYQDSMHIMDLEIPILSTHSNQWWIPFFDYGKETNFFYYFKPKYSSDYYSYNQRFELRQLSLETGEDKFLVEWQENVPFQLSPDENFLLIGTQFEQILRLDDLEISASIE
ncbi:hypothetical protein AJ85_20855 [Alkalihalobacillus alcalophilus ATCC 27647 = CGMCC 1.3604]|uniref:YqgU-like 6-bladed beta-propeller domain-containing protein n=1 Tax=Alkalihalobacillus alcalophilus ATCC 27647 = CGMCC 1.3604 TaxID=1218173 RepID=A0A094YTN8_ALKAL|nr:hypothetical protein [Alkalihalobacillus alcalophilus]KGA96832.1 hypothetical protein BALCAV_0213935 [Alkalihalobacillus alcalophilus ATCC 27647 = CGMCC 1.3604]MED1561221.1 hypothetical protein [Alkalihalobacillus alcalophilus]THG88850.1 hypothetical protein AJ85_20855 [Alkalihalobacillus alcalophilus ATCC 27647 = CGMCC 1.3604]